MFKTTWQLALPAYACLYFCLSLFFDVPAVEQVLAVLALLSLFIGLFTEFYPKYDGQIVIKKELDGKKSFLLEIDKDPDDLQNQDIVKFRVTSERASGYGDSSV
jgi:hypothetical protein